MDLKIHVEALNELAFWVKNDKRLALKILELISATVKDPFTGLGKPEPLKHNKRGFWSRRIDQEHRLVYVVTENTITIISCKGHYEE